MSNDNLTMGPPGTEEDTKDAEALIRDSFLAVYDEMKEMVADKAMVSKVSQALGYNLKSIMATCKDFMVNLMGFALAKHGVRPIVVPVVSDDRSVMTVHFYAQDLSVGKVVVVLPGTCPRAKGAKAEKPYVWGVTMEIDGEFAADTLCEGHDDSPPATEAEEIARAAQSPN